MFANLKNKLIEEVKASPSKFQQLANAAQAAVSSSSSSTPNSSENASAGTNENFFSITEEDTPQNSPYRIQKLPRGGRASTQSLNGVGGGGAIPRTRKLSNSSMASDVSFRLPSYDAPAMYHLQSDMDETSSEFDDSASTARLDVITKDQLYDAYKKSLDRYHKYRCRYTDLAKKYKELERDSSKARSVLVETQDKALRRISELREQCTLEQQAKAHLEEALRIEMDDMSCKMQAYQTKLKLLGENPENVTAALERGQATAAEQLIDLGEKPPTSNGNEINQEHEQDIDVSKLRQQLTEQEAELKQLRLNNEQAQSTIATLRKQEEENVLLLAQTKQAIHTELEHKDTEVRQLQDKLKQLEVELDLANTRETQSGDFKEQLKKLQAAKQETDAKLIATEHVLVTLRGSQAEKEEQVTAKQKKLEAELDLKGNELRKLEEKLKQQEENLSQKSNNKDIKKKLQLLEKAKQEAEAKLISTEEQLKTLKATEADREQQVAAKETQLQAKEIEIQQLQDKLKQLEDEFVFSNNLETQAKNTQGQLEVLQMAKTETEDKLIATEQLLNTFEAEQTEKEQELVKLQAQLDGKENEVQQLQQLLKQQEVELEQAANSAANMQNMKEQLEQLENAKTGAEIKYLSIEQMLNTLQMSHKIKAQQVIELEGQLESLKENELQQLQQQLLQREAELAAANSQGSQADDIKQQLQQLQSDKKDVDAKLAALEQTLNTFRLEHAVKEQQVVSLEAQLSALQTDSDQKLQDLRQHNDQLNEIVQRYQQNESTLDEVQQQLQLAREKLSEVERRVLETEKSLEIERETVAALTVEKSTAEEQILKLQRDLQTPSCNDPTCINRYKSQMEDLRKIAETATLVKEKELRASASKLNKLKKQHEQLQEEHKAQTNINAQLKSEADKVEQLHNEKQELQERVSVILEEITAMQTHVQEVQTAQTQLEHEKLKLEAHIEALQQQQQQNDAQGEVSTAKLVEIERENSKLAERNCLLEEQNNHLQKQHDELTKVQTKMQQVLDEHSKLQNAQEIMEHDHRTLQDKCDSFEKENLLVKDELNCMQQAKASLESQASTLQQDLEQAQQELLLVREQQHELQQQLEEHTQSRNELEASSKQLTTLQQANANLESQTGRLQMDLDQAQQQVTELREQQLELRMQLEDQTQRCVQLDATSEQLAALQETVHNLREQLQTLKDAEQVSQDKMQAVNVAHNSQLETLEARCTAANGDVQRLQEANDTLHREIETLRSVSKQQTNYEQLQIENEFLNKRTKQLELEAQATQGDSGDLKEKLKSLQCELYVLQEQAEQHANQLSEQDAASAAAKAETTKLKAALEDQALELTRQSEHASFVSEQSDAVQKELLHVQHQLQERQTELVKAQERCTHLEEQLQRQEKSEQEQTSISATTTTATTTLLPNDAEHLRVLNEKLQRELEDLKYKSSGEQSNLQQEIDELQANNKEMTERITELETLRAGIQAQQLLASLAPKTQQQQAPMDEKALLEAKLKDIMSEVDDVTTRNLFLEQKCENYLILEQSNERLKQQNAKLSRQLDETLVSIQHSDSVPANTEFEYLRNIMFQYLTGTTNNETLVKVISAVLKFSPQQAQVALEKEHQRRSLLNKLI